MRVVVFLDLDDTIFQTLPKCPDGAGLTPGALDREGRPLSFLSLRQSRLLELFQPTTIIPTTARNLDAFRRVTLRFDSLAILDFGGVVLLADGTLDPTWDARIRPRALSVRSELEQWCERLQSFSSGHALGVRVRVIADFGMPLYVVAKHPGGDVSALERLRLEVLAAVDSERFFVHANDNNLSVVPRFLGKEHAVQYVREQHLGGEALTIGVGDSLTDAGYLALCDFALLPCGSQLACRSLASFTPASGAGLT